MDSPRSFPLLFALSAILAPPAALANPVISYALVQDLTGVIESDAAWGDIDDDGDLDLVVCGEANAGRTTRTYRNDGGTLAALQDLVGIDGTGNDCLAWGDYDNDGDLDLAMAGTADTGRVALIYENDGAGHLTVDAAHTLTPVAAASLVWIDREFDGDLDLYVQGHDGTAGRATVYDNDGGVLSPLQSLFGLWSGSADRGLYDAGDVFPGLLVTGNSAGGDTTIFYHNSNGSFYGEGNRGVQNVRMSDGDLADFDNDGDPDLAITGEDGVSHYGRVYENDGWGNFTAYANLDQVYRSSVAWADQDNDGDMDVALCGYDGSGLSNDLYLHTGSGFAYSYTGWSATREGSLTWADVDGDGDLDFFMTGADWSTKYARLYAQSGGTVNAAPSAPSNLEGHLYVPTFGDRGPLYLRWDAAADPETPSAGLYYVLRVGTTPGGHELVSGVYGTPLLGNVGQVTQIDFPDVAGTIYYWSVRAIDSGLRAGPWAAERMICPEVLHHVEIDCIDDATVDQFYSTTTFDSWIPQMLHVGDFAGGGDIARAYLMFYIFGNVPGGANVQSAHLVMECVSVSCGEPFQVDVWEEGIDVWDEATITWNNAPTMWAPAASDRVTVPGPGIYAWDVTADVAATVDWDLTLVLRSGQPPEGSPCIAEFWSKDQSSGLKPFLDVFYTVVDTDVREAGVPSVFRLEPNAPNPFNPSTTIRFDLPAQARTTLRIYDVSGRLVRTLVDEVLSRGTRHEAVWDGRTDGGREAPSGVYFYRLTAGSVTETRKMVLLR